MSGTTFDDPNREAVGLAPIWSEAEVNPTAQAASAASADLEFDPAEYTVDEIKDYLAENPDQHDAVIAAERKGKNRASLTGG